MRKITLFFTCLIFTVTSYSQTLKIDNGIAINSLKGEDFDLFPDKIVSYSGMLGIEYFEKKWFYLSSEIGYLELGGKEGYIAGDPVSRDKQTWNYTQLNTTFRLRARVSKTEFYLGAGPYLNVLLGSGGFKNAMYSGYTTQRTNWGCKTELGMNAIVEKFKIGLNCTYLLPFSSVAKSPYTAIDARSLAVYLSCGYRLN